MKLKLSWHVAMCACAWLSSGCGAPEIPVEDDPCGAHGASHGDHCHCDAGYEEVGGTCVARALDAGLTDAGVDPCGSHGEQHGDHCHCDAGYEEVGGTCVAVVGMACGDGHRHGATCVCYAGFIYSATTDTCEPVVPPVGQEVLTFTIVALGEEGANSGMNSVNTHRQVVGNTRPAGQTYLSAYTQSVQGNAGNVTVGPLSDLGILPGSSNQFSRPWDVNVHGQVAGESGNNNPVLPFIYLPGTGLQALPLPVGSASAVAHGINDAGRLVGIGNSRAISWASSQATPDYLASHHGATVLSSRAWKLNEHGDIVGHARDDHDRQRATWWKSDGAPVDLGALNPAHASEALDVNEAGQIVGKSFVGVVPGSTSGTLQAQAFLYENGSMRGLGLLPSAPAALHSIANAISDDGWVVGQVEQIAGLAQRAVLWREGVIVDLNDYLPASSGWVLTSAVDVNEHGDIVGRGTLNGSARPFMLIRH